MLRKSNKSAGWNWLPLGVMVELLVLTAPESGVMRNGLCKYGSGTVRGPYSSTVLAWSKK